jgi:hypothetical protein
VPPRKEQCHGAHETDRDEAALLNGERECGHGSTVPTHV